MANIDIGGRLHSTATGNVVAGANEIFDDDEQLKQSQINGMVLESIDEINQALDTKQGVITTDPEVTIINEEGGTPTASVDFVEGQLKFTLENFKGDKGDKGDEGPKGTQGDSAVYNPDPSLTPVFEIANTTGLSTTKSMSQKAVTEMNHQRLTKWTHFPDAKTGRIYTSGGVSTYENKTGYTFIQSDSTICPARL
jgi:hypothetical protein